MAQLYAEPEGVAIEYSVYLNSTAPSASPRVVRRTKILKGTIVYASTCINVLVVGGESKINTLNLRPNLIPGKRFFRVQAC